MVNTAKVWRASEQVERAVRELSEALTEPEPSEDRVRACNWTLIRALAGYRDAASSSDVPEVLDWVPALFDMEAGDHTHNKVILFATWMFDVADAQRVAAAGQSVQTAFEDNDDVTPVDSAADAVAVLFDKESMWPDAFKYERIGLDLEFAEHSAHTMLADPPGASTGDVSADIDGSNARGDSPSAG